MATVVASCIWTVFAVDQAAPDVVFAVLFTFEMFIRGAANGLVLGRTAFARRSFMNVRALVLLMCS